MAIAANNGLKVVEIPVSVRYEGLESTSKKHPLSHGQELLFTLLRLVVEEKPLIFLGIPGILSLLVGGLFGAWMLHLYALERNIVTNVALASISFVLIGFFAVSTAITLYSIKRLLKRREFTIAQFFPEMRVKYCEEEELRRLDSSLTSFININTKRDLLKMQEMLKRGEREELLKVH